MAVVSLGKPVGPRIMRKLWSNGSIRNLREQTDDKEGEQTEDNQRERGVASQLRAASEDTRYPMVAPPDYDIRQSGRVLELRNRDLYSQPTDMSSHVPILMTIREEPFKNYGSRSSEKWKAKEDKIEETKKKMKRSDDE